MGLALLNSCHSHNVWLWLSFWREFWIVIITLSWWSFFSTITNKKIVTTIDSSPHVFSSFLYNPKFSHLMFPDAAIYIWQVAVHLTSVAQNWPRTARTRFRSNAIQSKAYLLLDQSLHTLYTYHIHLPGIIFIAQGTIKFVLNVTRWSWLWKILESEP